MLELSLNHYLAVSAIMFALGIFGIFLNRKNVITILMSIELMLLAVNINMVAFSAYGNNLDGQVFFFVYFDGGSGRSGYRPCYFSGVFPQPRVYRG
jgi:NADH:ubiquinone oxidoreductase subunit K